MTASTMTTPNIVAPKKLIEVALPLDEIMLLNTACAQVDGAYQLIAEKLKPGIRENQLVAEVTKLCRR